MGSVPSLSPLHRRVESEKRMTRAVESHPFQPAWGDAVREPWRILETLIASRDEPGFLECMAVFGLALSLMIPAIWFGGW